MRVITVFDRVVDQVGQAAAQCGRTRHHRQRRLAVQRHVLAGVAGIAADAVEQRIEVERLQRLRAVHAARQIEPFAHHQLHGRQVAHQLVAQLFIRHLFQPQPQTRQRRLQVVRNGGQHLGALSDVLANPCLHRVEGGRGAPDLAGAVLGQRRPVDVAPQIVGRLRQLLQGLHRHAGHDVGQKSDAGQEQHEVRQEIRAQHRHRREQSTRGASAAAPA